MKTYFIKLQINTPRDYKNKTLKGVCIANSPKEASENCVERIKSQVSEKNPGLEFDITAKEVIVCDDFVFNLTKQSK